MAQCSLGRQHADNRGGRLSSSSLRQANRSRTVSAELSDAAIGLYRNRADKNWGLTDCLSFVVMERRTLTEALTTDRHFEQAGFQANMLDHPGA